LRLWGVGSSAAGEEAMPMDDHGVVGAGAAAP